MIVVEEGEAEDSLFFCPFCCGCEHTLERRCKLVVATSTLGSLRDL